MLFEIRPKLASLPGTTAPQPFGGSLRSIVVNLNPDRLRAYNLSPEKVAQALDKGNIITPSGNARIKDQMPIVSVNSIVVDPKDLGNIPIKPEEDVYLRDLGTVQDTTDIPTGWALVNGRRAVYMPILKTADASTLTVANQLKNNMDDMRSVLPKDCKLELEFDQSPYVTGAVGGVVQESAIGAVLTGPDGAAVPGRLAQRDRGRAHHPAVADGFPHRPVHHRPEHQPDDPGRHVAGGRHPRRYGHRGHRKHPYADGQAALAGARRARRHGGNHGAHLAGHALHPGRVLAVVPDGRGGQRSLFVPLAISVGFAMITAFILSITFVPVLSIWMLKPHAHGHADVEAPPGRFSFAAFRRRYVKVVTWCWPRAGWCWAAMLPLAAGSGARHVCAASRSARRFPRRWTPASSRCVSRPPWERRLEVTEDLTRQALKEIKDILGPDSVKISVAHIGQTAPTLTANAVFLWTSGPDQAVIRIALNEEKACSTPRRSRKSCARNCRIV